MVPVVAVLVAWGFVAVGNAPAELTMGSAHRILYVHVSVAWVGLVAFSLMAVCGLGYLLTSKMKWDHWGQASAEIGWICSTLTLLTGSLWAHFAWGTWWTWDPRLLTSFVLWALFSGYFILRAGVDEPHRRATLGAVLAVIGFADVPLVTMATRWYRGIHPVSPEMDPMMQHALLACALGVSAMMALLLIYRCRQLDLEKQILDLKMDVTDQGGKCHGISRSSLS